MPSWFRYTSYMLKYTCFLYHPSYTHNHENTITRRRSHNQDRTRIRVRFRPSPHKPTAREMESVRATLQEGRYYLGCGRQRCFLKVCCLSDKGTSSGFWKTLLAASQSLSSIPRRSLPGQIPSPWRPFVNTKRKNATKKAASFLSPHTTTTPQTTA